MIRGRASALSPSSIFPLLGKVGAGEQAETGQNQSNQKLEGGQAIQEMWVVWGGEK